MMIDTRELTIDYKLLAKKLSLFFWIVALARSQIP